MLRQAIDDINNMEDHENAPYDTIKKLTPKQVEEKRLDIIALKYVHIDEVKPSKNTLKIALYVQSFPFCVFFQSVLLAVTHRFAHKCDTSNATGSEAKQQWILPCTLQSLNKWNCLFLVEYSYNVSC